MRGNKMAVLILCFLASVMFFVAGLYFYDNQGNTAFHKTMELIRKTNAEVKTLSDLVTSNIGTVSSANLKVKAMEEEVQKMRNELDVFRDQVADTREKQIKLREALSRKNVKVTLPTGPIPIEFYTESTIHGSPHIKANPKEIKKIKKQMEGLSK